MEKSLIVKFVKEKRKGVYNVIVKTYKAILEDNNVTLIRRAIELDLENHTGEKINLNYDSLIKAVRRSLSKKAPLKQIIHSSSPKATRYDFKDDHELDDSKKARPGSFKI